MASSDGSVALAEPAIFRELRELVAQCRLAVCDARDLVRLARAPGRWSVRNLHRPFDVSHMPRVLLLDSNADTAEMYATGLRIEGFVPAIAEDLGAAFEHMRRGQPDALVAEASEAARDNWQIVRWCREGEAGRTVPVVLLTGYPTAAIPAAATNLGCTALLKPCLPETLVQVIRALLDHQAV